jgi:hypothetical protein
LKPSAPPPRPPDHAPRATALEVLTTLSYELLDAHGDTIELATDLPADQWRAHLDYLRALQRSGRELLAQTWSDGIPR